MMWILSLGVSVDTFGSSLPQNMTQNMAAVSQSFSSNAACIDLFWPQAVITVVTILTNRAFRIFGIFGDFLICFGTYCAFWVSFTPFTASMTITTIKKILVPLPVGYRLLWVLWLSQVADTLHVPGAACEWRGLVEEQKELEWELPPERLFRSPALLCSGREVYGKWRVPGGGLWMRPTVWNFLHTPSAVCAQCAPA